MLYSTLFLNVLSISLVSSIIIFILFLLSAVLNRTYTARSFRFLWLILIIRLLVPVTVPLNEFTIKIPIPEHFSIEQTKTIETSKGWNYLKGIAPQEQEESSVMKNGNIPLIKICTILWVSGMLVITIKYIADYWKLKRLIKRWQHTITDEQIIHLFEQLKLAMDISCSIDLISCKAVTTPMMLGFSQPSVILPSYKDFSLDELQLILKHELCHYKRYDLLYKLALVCVNIIHWFNPAIYLLVSEASKCIELSCDNDVIAGENLMYRQRYNDVILSTMTKNSKNTSPLTTHFSCEIKTLKKRFLNILDMQPKRRGTELIYTIFIVIIMASSILTLTAFSTLDINAQQKRNTVLPQTNASTMKAPITLNYCKIAYDNDDSKWPYVQFNITNHFDQALINYEIALLAYDNGGNPMELYWDAVNVDKNGDYGNVGFAANGINYDVVAGIQPNSPKMLEWYIIDDFYPQDSLKPGETQIQLEGGWVLFDGWWDQPDGVHKVHYVLGCIKNVTFEDGSTWQNPKYDTWIATYRAKAVDVSSLQSYYPQQ